MMKHLAIITAVILATLTVVAIIVTYPEAVVLFLLSLSVAAAARPMVDGLMKRGVVRGLAVVITYLNIVGMFVLIVFVVSGPLFTDLQHLSDQFVVSYDQIWARWPTGTQLQRTIVAQLPPPEKLYEGIAGKQGEALAQNFLGWTASSLSVISQIFAVLILSVYWTIDRIHFERLWLSLVPVDLRARWRTIWRDIETDLGAYIRSEAVQSLLAGILLATGYTLIGLRFPTMLALFGAIAWLIPWLGALIAVIPVFIVGIIFAGPVLAIGASIYTVAVLLFLELVIEPRLFTRRSYSSWLTILFLMALGDSLGLVGLILAPPLATVTQIFIRRIFQSSTQTLVAAQNPSIESARQIASLDDRLVVVREIINQMEDKPSQQTASMLDRLDKLVKRANGIVSEEGDRGAV